MDYCVFIGSQMCILLYHKFEIFKYKYLKIVY